MIQDWLLYRSPHGNLYILLAFLALTMDVPLLPHNVAPDFSTLQALHMEL